jgi:hypothetical protein
VFPHAGLAASVPTPWVGVWAGSRATWWDEARISAVGRKQRRFRFGVRRPRRPTFLPARPCLPPFRLELRGCTGGWERSEGRGTAPTYQSLLSPPSLLLRKHGPRQGPHPIPQRR